MVSTTIAASRMTLLITFWTVYWMSMIVMPLSRMPISKRADDHVADAAAAAGQADAAQHDDEDDVVDEGRS